MTQADLDAAWPSVVKDLKRRGFKIRDVDDGAGVAKYGIRFGASGNGAARWKEGEPLAPSASGTSYSAEEASHALVNALMLDHDWPKKGTVLVRSTPTLDHGYLRARLGFVKVPT